MVAEKKEQAETKKNEGEVKTEVPVKKETPTPTPKKVVAKKGGPATRKAAAAKKVVTPKKVVVVKEEVPPAEKVDDAKVDDEKDKKSEEPAPAAAAENGTEEQKPEQKPEVTTSTTENDECDSKQDSATLILSAEEEAEISAQTNEDAVKTCTTKSSAPATAKKENQKNVWVSNLARGSKAADLKKLFSEKFTVESAKIVTNGKSFFGYICLENPEMAQKSVDELNATSFAGRDITVSLARPDVRRGGVEAKRREERRKEVRAAAKKTEKKDEKDGEKTDVAEQNGKDDANKDGKESSGDKDKSKDKDKKQEETEEEKQFRRRELRYQRTIQDLRADVKRLTTELQNNRRRLTDANKRLDSERDRKVSMRRDLTALENQMKSERRRFTQEIEQMGKKVKLDEIRYQENRAVLNKELDECRKLREFLERKSEDMGLTRSHRAGGSPRRPGPNARPTDRGAKDLHRSRGGRSPPPPPKIRRSRERSPHPYKGSKKPRMEEPSHHGSSTHYTGSQSYSSSSKPVPSYYNQGGGPPRSQPMFVNASSFPAQRYNSGGYTPSFPMGNPSSLMSRPVGYPGSSGGQRKY